MQDVQTFDEGFAEHEGFTRRARHTGGLERWGLLAAGGAMIVYGLTRRSTTGAWMAAAGAPLVYRGVAGRNAWRFGMSTDTKVALGGPRGTHVRESVRIERAVDELYRFWRRFENLPRFMSNLEQVVDRGDGRSHWVAKGPGGMQVEWDAEIVNDIQDKLISWRSLPGSEVVTAGSVQFRPVRGGRSTQISVRLQYEPPAGKMGSAVASLFGREPSQTIREDLRRLKQILEAGEVPTATSHGGAR
jgi:uncharacterized membrane protein